MTAEACWAHNARDEQPAAYHWHTATGNTIPLCTQCAAQWRADVAARTCYPPARITQIAPETQ